MAQNILLMISDAFRYDRIERSLPNGKSLTPHINSLVDDGEIFTHCFATADKTSPSMTTIETGLYPLRHGLLHHGGAVTTEEQDHLRSVQNIAEWLSDTHYTIGIDILHHQWLTKGYNEFRPQPSNTTTMGRLKKYISDMPKPISLPAKVAYQSIKRMQSSIETLTNSEADIRQNYGAGYSIDQRAHWQTNQFLDFIEGLENEL